MQTETMHHTKTITTITSKTGTRTKSIQHIKHINTFPLPPSPPLSPIQREQHIQVIVNPLRHARRLAAPSLFTPKKENKKRNRHASQPKEKERPKLANGTNANAKCEYPAPQKETVVLPPLMDDALFLPALPRRKKNKRRANCVVGSTMHTIQYTGVWCVV